MTITKLPALFEGSNLDIYEIGGERWLRVSQIVTPLGFTNRSAISNTVKRNPTDFGLDETMTVELPTAGGMQLTRLFSHLGIAKLAMLATTPQAARFRDWAARELVHGAQPVQDAPCLPPATADLRDQIIFLQREIITLLRSPPQPRLEIQRPGISRRWTDEEIATMHELAAKRYSARQIGGQLGRTANSIRNKWGERDAR